MKREYSEQLKKIKERGDTVYSFSRLDTMEQCEYQYFLSYKEKQKGIDNIYGLLGGRIHDTIEMIYNDEANKGDLKKSLDNVLLDCELMGVTFPNEDIAKNWKLNMYDFVDNFKKLEHEFVTEEHILFEIFKGIWFQGYIDAYTKPNDNNEIDIIDWKTSSKFSKKEMPKKARQLILYKLGKERQGYTVNKIGWFMMKYIYVSYDGKKPKMCERRKWIKEMNVISKAKDTMGLSFWEIQLKNLGIDEFDIEFILEDAVNNNNINAFPEEIKNKITIEDCIVWYEPNEEEIDDVINFVKDTVYSIESKLNDEIDWEPVNIDDKQSFFCQNLCNHRKTCKYLKEYLTKKEKNDIIEMSDDDDLF